MYLINGESKHSIEVSDRGLQYGDGVFETIEVFNGAPVFFKQHIQRLLQGCVKLFIPPPDTNLLTTEAIRLINGAEQAILKIMVTRGNGGRGYNPPDQPDPTRILSLHPFPEYPYTYQQLGITVGYSEFHLGLNPDLAGIKHMNRLEQVIARAKLNSSNYQEGLMQDVNGHVVEGIMSNIFLVKESILMTPLIDVCGVSGIIRNLVIRLATENQIQVVEKTITKHDIQNADELFICNSIIGIWPVQQVELKKYRIGDMTRLLQRLLSRLKKEDA